MNVYDVIVIGAGPAGSMAGYHLASAGLSILILDKARFPRRKVCGGALTQRGLQALPFDISPLIHRIVDWGYVGFRGHKVCTIRSEKPLSYLIDRTTFDDFLLLKAIEVGAACHQGERVIGISQSTDRVIVSTPTGSYQAHFVVGADGIHSIVASQTGLLPDGTISLSFEARMACPTDLKGSLTDSITFDFGTLPWGYGWIFPKRDHLNVGVFRNWPGKRTTKKHLLRFIHQHPGLREEDILDIRAFPGPTGGTSGPVHRGRVLLAGDAAHLADPWLGEGISYAILSGQMAAETIQGQLDEERPDLSPYSERINQQFVSQFIYARKMSVLVNLFYGLNVRFLKRSPTLQAIIVDLLRGERTYREIWQELKTHFPSILWKILTKK
jgi:geranylgeranyl reductase family protein